MTIARFNKEDSADLTKFGVSEVVVKLDHKSKVISEIGFDDRGRIVHRFPGEGEHGRHGIFDEAIILVHAPDHMNDQEFDNMFALGK